MFLLKGTLPPPPPTLTLSSPPPSGLTVTPDPLIPDSVSLSCSLSNPSDDHHYQWRWWRNELPLTSSQRVSINTQSKGHASSLKISGLQYSDAGDYTCGVSYARCTDRVECSSVNGTINLNLPGWITYSIVLCKNSDPFIFVITPIGVLLLVCKPKSQWHEP